MTKRKKVVIIGAGPAGLSAAYEFLKQNKLKNFQICILEQEDQVGGISKTLKYQGYRFDLGGHRFYSNIPEINNFYQTFLKEGMLIRQRLSRIYYNKKFYNYPLSAVNALFNLGLRRSLKILISWGNRQLHPYSRITTFEEWVSSRFGDELFKIFFKSYTEKVWGIPTSRLSADWAAQRIQNFNLSKAVINALFKINPGAKTIISKFFYPKHGPGLFYENMQNTLAKKGVNVNFQMSVNQIQTNNKKVISVTAVNRVNGKKTVYPVDYLISTMPFNQLVSLLKPPQVIKNNLSDLKFRNFLTVNLIIRSNPFPDQWIYIHDPKVKVGRIQNFRNWSSFMVKEGENNTPIGMEYFCTENDNLWKMADQDLIALAKKEITKIGLAKAEDVLDGFVHRVNNAYPVYDSGYRDHLEKARKLISRYLNLYPCGRGGLFRYNNMDHSILTGFYTARNIIAGVNKHDVWSINDETAYLEEKK